VFGVRSAHLAAPVAVEVDAGRTLDKRPQIHGALGVDAQDSIHRAATEVWAARRDVGGDPDFQRSMRLVDFEREGLREPLGEMRQGRVPVFLR
jgi:hypothetical protein